MEFQRLRFQRCNNLEYFRIPTCCFGVKIHPYLLKKKRKTFRNSTGISRVVLSELFKILEYFGISKKMKPQKNVGSSWAQSGNIWEYSRIALVTSVFRKTFRKSTECKNAFWMTESIIKKNCSFCCHKYWINIREKHQQCPAFFRMSFCFVFVKMWLTQS